MSCKAIALCLGLAMVGLMNAASAMEMLPRQGVTDTTTLISDGRPNATIVYPNDPAYTAVVDELQNALTTAGLSKLPAVAADEATVDRFFLRDALKAQNVIFVGNLADNPAMVQLGARCAIYVTPVWPGENGYVLRTITNPWGTKTNCIVVGGSNATAAMEAAKVFATIVAEHAESRSVTLPRLMQIVVDGKLQADLPAARPKHDARLNGTYQLATAIEVYHTTGSDAQLAQVRQLLDAYLQASNPPAAQDYGTECAVRMLDLVDSFLLTPDENLKMDNLLLDWVVDVLKKRYYWFVRGRSWSFGGHQACGTMAMYAVCDYLLRNSEPDEKARRVLERCRNEARQFLNYMSESFKDRQKDMAGWETWSPYSVLPRYALAEQDMTYFENGMAQQVVRRAFYADRPAGYSGEGYGPAGMIAFLYNDGGMARWTPMAAAQKAGRSFLKGRCGSARILSRQRRTF